MCAGLSKEQDTATDLEGGQILEVGQGPEPVLLNVQLPQPGQADEGIRVDVPDTVPVEDKLLFEFEWGVEWYSWLRSGGQK